MSEVFKFPQVWFYAFGAVTVAFALVVVLSRNIVHCAMSLAATFIGVAAIYLLFDAPFLAAVQVLIYVGAVTVLILFAVMLSQKFAGGALREHNTQSLPAAAAIIIFLATLIPVLVDTWGGVKAPGAAGQGTVQALGALLMRPYVIPFEVASLLLLAAMIGAIIIARRD